MKKHNIGFEQLPASAKSYITHLERMRSDFVANLSHELRTPLTVMQGYLEILIKQDAVEMKSYHKIFTQMYQHSLRMANIIEDLLLLSRLESDEYQSEDKSWLNIEPLLSVLVEEARNISGSKAHVITLTADSSLQLRGQESEMRSLFSNIIINAVKYTPAQGKIEVKWYRNESAQAIFSVTDTGIGIAKADIPRLTERFYRVDKARSRDSGGTGLGLAIVKHVILRHGGDLQIESQLDRGSTFTCIFPESKNRMSQ